jgi:c(7)-type cytochrome triheme protein
MQITSTSIRIGLAIIVFVCSVAANEYMSAARAQTHNETSSPTQDAEAAFLEELHYSQEGFMHIYESLPRDEENKVDWERATREGLINPLASIDVDSGEEFIMDFEVVIKFNDMLIKDVVFSHAVHTYWLNCNSCHPRIFKPEIAANRMTMKEIREGKYCGLCHGMVAFPADVIDAPNFRANCLRCHRAQRG